MSRLVVLEGLDGAGTTTQARLAVAYLGDRNCPAHLTREPSDNPIGLLLREFLAGRHAICRGDDPTPVELDPATLALLFTADRMDHLQREVEPELTAGRVVVSDRWYHSSLAYQSGAGVDLDWIAACNSRARRPDLTIFLRIDPEVAAARRAAAGRSRELFDDLETQRRVNEGYGRAIKLVMTRGERVEVLDGKLPVHEVAAQVAALIDDLVGLTPATTSVTTPVTGPSSSTRSSDRPCPTCGGKLRKVTACAITGRLMDKGEAAYRPIGNGMKRWQRIAASEIEKS